MGVSAYPLVCAGSREVVLIYHASDASDENCSTTPSMAQGHGDVAASKAASEGIKARGTNMAKRETAHTAWPNSQPIEVHT